MVAWVALAVILMSHGTYLTPCVGAMRSGRRPRAIDLAGVSVVIFFDFGVLLEALGVAVPDPHMGAMFAGKESSVIAAVLLVAAAPWLLRLGWRITAKQTAQNDIGLQLWSGAPRRWFYLVLGLVCAVCALCPIAAFGAHPRLWESRALMGSLLGPFIIVLSLPMYLLAFYARLRESRRGWGRVVMIGTAAASVLATFCAGQRTLVLLPVLIVLLFGSRFTWRRWVAVGALAGAFAAMLLPWFKYSAGETDSSATQLLAEVMEKDFYRGPELVRAMGMASWFGTNTVAYPGAGYVYAGLFFVPRSWAPFKGGGTAQAFTAKVMQSDSQGLEWGFGISAISEAVLNFGLVAAPLVLVGYGVAAGWLESLAARWVSLEVPLMLAGLWVFGYHLPALLLNFGAMAVVGVICEKCFAMRVGNALADTSSAAEEGANL